ncbi:amidohydrolase family protein [Meiothermus granaticius]|uniref:Cytosine deaminase n=1 Tax=Meiothermus granaticius NBRC 107808 TaxID=1227551 RepID=A0A399FBN6_9DEIN|nr:amidohydrolase family protein [Meiothermus granaticius]RIH93563.1 Cytosine deaminase [Meiothermus granaticius NBRC 107808]GEM87201.1 cytosine deaminase [Meiothermus granaticius NBRC 107808]
MDLILRRATLPTGSQADIGLEDGHVAAIEEALAGRADMELALEGRLTLPAFVNPHLHACKSLWSWELAKQPAKVQALHRFEALGHIKRSYTPEGVYQRGRRLLQLAVQNGTCAIRLFADVDEQAGLRAFEGIKRLQAEFPYLKVQVVPFPQNGFARFPENRDLLEEAVARGCDAVGAVPWLEPTEADAQAHAEFCLELAKKHNLPLHAVADDTEDPQSATGAYLAALAVRHRWPLLLTQLGSLGFQDDATARKTIGLIKEAGATVISNGHIELVTCQSTRQPIPRGNTRVRELLAAGVRVVAAQDDVDNPYYPFGRNDPLEVALWAAHLTPLAWGEDLETLRQMVTTWPAQALGVEGYGLEVGCRANLVVLDAPSWLEALRGQVAKRYVILEGQLRAEERREVQLYEG